MCRPAVFPVLEAAVSPQVRLCCPVVDNRRGGWLTTERGLSEPEDPLTLGRNQSNRGDLFPPRQRGGGGRLPRPTERTVNDDDDDEEGRTRRRLRGRGAGPHRLRQ